MEILSSLQGFVLEKFVPFIILLGLLIFVHELGHFLVAKFFKVRIEVFSLGFGKKIFQFVRGHTTYCISLIPLGGYVKMFGDDPTAEIPDDLATVAFTKKPVGQRIAIVLAGPLMNFFFAVLIFTVVALAGEKTLGPVVGDVEPGSHAAKAGFLAGDKIASVNGQTVETWDEIEERVENNINRELRFEVERNGTTATIVAAPKKTVNENPMKWPDHLGEIEGLVPVSRASVIGVNTSSDNPATKSGLQPLDHVVSVNGQPVKLWRQLEQQLISQFGQPSVVLEIERFQPMEGESPEKKTPVKLTLDLSEIEKQTTPEQSLRQLGIENSEIYLSHISEGMPAENSGLQSKDKILTINGKKIEDWKQVIATVNSYEENEKPLRFEVLREGEVKTFLLTPKINAFMNQHGQEEHRYQVGIGPAIYTAVEDFTIRKADGLLTAAGRGWDQTIHWTSAISVSFVRMLQAKVSPKNIGGIVTIGQVASETFKAGLTPYLRIMAIISINLFILNLLPIPILDGGHLVLYTIEALRGAPLSMKKLELAQQIGLIILMSLMAFALFNDISRIW